NINHGFVRTYGGAASFQVQEIANQAGGFRFVSEDTTGQHTWDFGDGNTSTNPSPTHVYEVPGTFTVTHCRTLGAESDCADKPVVVAANEMTAWVRLAHDDADDESGDFALGEEFSVRL